MLDNIAFVMAQILQVPQESITADSSPENLDRWDSLKHMQLIMALEDEFDVQFPDEAIPNLLSVQLIEQKLTELKGQ
jgi:acyl carrier protein